MSSEKYTLTLNPHGRKLTAMPGSNLLKDLIHHSIFLRADCGGKGTCGKCRVEITQPDGSTQMVSACQTEVDSDMSVRIPEATMQSSHIMSKAPLTFPQSYLSKRNKTDTRSAYGVAVDLGTTTIAVYLCRTNTGEVLGSCAVKNPQAIYGDDVMSRISVIGQDSANLKILQKAVVGSIEQAMEKLISGLKSEDVIQVEKMTVVGNPAMIHILLGVDPATIGVSPYQPAFNEPRSVNAGDLGFERSDFSVKVLSQVSGFIGGDILAAAIAVDLEHQPEGTLLVDLGTNGELLLKGHDGYYATSCATGPAFEGASLSCGMQAIPGAVNAVTLDDTGKVVALGMVGESDKKDIKPAGICGAGVINSVAQLYRHGIVEAGGRFADEGDRFVLAEADPAEDLSSVFLSQKDIRSVQLGKSALLTGIEFLTRRAGMERPKTILIAGAFGSHLNIPDLICLGILPAMAEKDIISKGNAAGAGAVMALCDPGYVKKAKAMAEQIDVVELACDVSFQQVFVENLSFPDPENLPV